jgi:hypothetical protein
MKNWRGNRNSKQLKGTEKASKIMKIAKITNKFKSLNIILTQKLNTPFPYT